MLAQGCGLDQALAQEGGSREGDDAQGKEFKAKGMADTVSGLSDMPGSSYLWG
ncbi:hypothetical protein [Desulfogranum mediterraneum]|uniref:hypothetical protein n=1 Tax=Desulfogranum mediterraneum TaxID=160661 RepID=UPI0004101F4C|nr:hypothetical protein [Desulfogranum mediterraneum]